MAEQIHIIFLSAILFLSCAPKRFRVENISRGEYTGDYLVVCSQAGIKQVGYHSERERAIQMCADRLRRGW